MLQLDSFEPLTQKNPTLIAKLLLTDGYLHLDIGSMFAGKTSAICTLISRYRSINIEIFVIKHSLDTRYTLNKISTHDNKEEECYLTDNLDDIYNHEKYKRCKMIAIEEAQFFGDQLLVFVKHATDIDHKHIYIYALNGDYKRESFKCISDLLPLANSINKRSAFCYYCQDGTPGDFTLRTVDSNEKILIGTDMYKAACRKHYLQFAKTC